MASRCTAGSFPTAVPSLTFSDYCRNALRMAALMRIRSIFVFTHDSIGLGEDGTDTPGGGTRRFVAADSEYGRVATLRYEESVVAWVAALERRDGPACLIFSRQNLPFQKRSADVSADIARGGYVLVEPEGAARAVIISTGSEIGLAVEAQKALAASGSTGSGGVDARNLGV